MKKLLFALAIGLSAWTAQAQLVTNIDTRVTVTVINTGVSTNQTQATLNLSGSGSKKDQNRIAGWLFAYNTYKAGGGQLALENWIKQDVADRADSYATAKAQADNAALAAKISNLLLTNPDLLSNADLSSLATIAAKAP